MVYAVWLTSAGANFNVVGKASLSMSVAMSHGVWIADAMAHPHSSIESAGHVIVLLQPRATP